MSAADLRARYGPCAVVAGASEGLGAAFAEALAARGLDLLLLARREEPLEALAASLRARHRVKVETAALDLGRPDLASAILPLVTDREIGLLVYNAAYSRIGPFLEQPLSDQLRMVDVNCRGPLVLAHLLGGPMAVRGRGAILLMTSLAGSQGSPLIATYGATKAFNLVLAEALWDELRELGVDVLACRAGATRTPSFESSRPAAAVPLMEPGAVVAEALSALGRGPGMVPGLVNRLAVFGLGRLLPRRLAVRIMGQRARAMYGDKLSG